MPRNRTDYYPYDVTVTAHKIVGGVLRTGTATLGGSYYRDEELIGEVHGYLPQMVDEAVEDLERDIATMHYSAQVIPGVGGFPKA